MKVGDVVSWESQASGAVKKKTGVIVAVVPAKHNARIILGDFKDCQWAWGGGFSRNHESYLVSVKTGKSEEAKKTIYWPRVSSLKMEES